MKNILIINGPNLNLLGKREPEIYGSTTFDAYFETLKAKYADKAVLTYFQSNHEGALLDEIHAAGFEKDAIIINAGAFTHTSVALADAIKGVPAPFIEVHISNTHARETFRHHSYISPVAKGIIMGLGLKVYDLAIEGVL
jgi:3-dehydroquinate dehydratase-2